MSEKELITEFLLAAEQGNADGLKSCLAKNVDINATNRQGRTAIIIASLNKHYDCVSLLIAAGADINKQDQTCFNPFLISCLTNCEIGVWVDVLYELVKCKNNLLCSFTIFLSDSKI